MPKAYAESKIVVVPSRYESFGLPALQEASRGLPVIATNVGGLREVLDYAPSMLVSRPDIDPSATKIQKILH
jgi:glycosyltransferase involved in cell wall biosynthesis